MNHKNYEKNDKIVCSCSGGSIFNLIEGKTKTDHFLWSAVIKKKEYCDCCTIVEIVPYEQLNDECKKLIDICVDFLAYREEWDDSYTLWDFICSFLNIEQDGGIDYLLMNMLDWYEFSKHGGGIRCSLLNKPNYKCPKEHVELFREWTISEKKKKYIKVNNN